MARDLDMTKLVYVDFQTKLIFDRRKLSHATKGLIDQCQILSEPLHLTGENRHIDFCTECSDRNIGTNTDPVIAAIIEPWRQDIDLDTLVLRMTY
jgi:hypothetical protein